jgi:hypothetical protein
LPSTPISAKLRAAAVAVKLEPLPPGLVRGSFVRRSPEGKKAMRALIIVMLAVQVGIFLATAWTILFARTAAGRPRPIWSSLAVSLIIVAGTSWRIADAHDGQAGADILAFCALLLLGMGLMAALLQIRQRRGLDNAP